MIIHACFIFVLRFTSAGLAMFSVRFGSDEVIKKKRRTAGPTWACGQLAYIYIYWKYS